MAVSVQEIKEKFSTVQSIGQSLKEEKISLESELRTLTSDYNDQVAKLLEKTGASTLEEAIQVYKQRKEKLDADMTALSDELSGYLDTYGENADGV
jgi:predicted  nucleic acid-binding Zn-ribbon protein